MHTEGDHRAVGLEKTLPEWVTSRIASLSSSLNLGFLSYTRSVLSTLNILGVLSVAGWDQHHLRAC